jgi:sulfate permease, SulP family
MPPARVLRVELLAGLVVALALIPEAISFSLIAGVDPKVGLYASFTIGVTIAIAGGRPAMISAATGAMALVVVGLVQDHGVEYLLAAGVLAGLIQIALGVLGVPRLMRFVPRSVMTGFVNALAILIFLAQVPYIREGGGLGLVLIAGGLLVIYLLPRVVPAGSTCPMRASCRARCRCSVCRACRSRSRPCRSSCRTRWRSPPWACSSRS